MKLRVEHFFRPLAFGFAFLWREPTLLRVVHKRPIGTRFAEMKVRPEIVRAETLEELTVSTRARREFRRAFAVREQHRALVVLHVCRPNAIDLMQ